MLVANKVCRFGGRPYVKGEPVPDKYIDPRGLKRLLDADILREVPDEKQASSHKEEPVVANEPKQEEPAVDNEPKQEEPVEVTEAVDNDSDVDLESLDRNQLYHIAKEKGLDVKPTMSKAKLLEALA